ncbi:SDR family NAD(P)-dependent oxidoreductase [Kutzneria sp. CA-103260]|uniref:SDR family NAD(P)-dependent oxidoreductase n=1 Tax=Kutzneria sp. CA-103260 TaxID=2802641 RepID=UPI001BA463FD|nr:SDR family NAD(P)-dependent oxidoreductase [Kutzneria sp. CA-103260]QUQ63526.1 SDR family NAD(P)-dependent oxidoreductase [Kutzneria sp. CA-103260]
MTSWDVHRPPPAEGRTALVTGGNAGIGYFVAEQLAGAGATVVLGCRSADRAAAAMTAIRSRHPSAALSHLPLDLGDLPSLQESADRLDVRLDAVVLNAGMLFDGPDPDERTFAVNHLGHFALTARLAPHLSRNARVVTTGSFVAKSADFAAQEPDGKKVYARSKLAQMLFGFELARRGVFSVVNHPGGALDSLTPSRPPVHTRPTGFRLPLLQGKDAGAWPAVRCVLDPFVQSGQLWGPRLFGLRGRPHLEPVRGILADTALAARVWDLSVELTGVDPAAALLRRQ